MRSFVALIFTLYSSMMGCQRLAHPQDPFLTSQLLQQQLEQAQFKHAAIKYQLQELQRQFQVNQENKLVFESLLAKQNILLHELENEQHQLSQLKLKLEIDERNGVKSFSQQASNFNDHSDNVLLQNRNSAWLSGILEKNILWLGECNSDITQNCNNLKTASQQSSTAFKFSPFGAIVINVDDSPCNSTISGSGFCKPLVKCLAFYADIPELRRQPCRLQEGEFGICCPTQGDTQGHEITKNSGVLTSPTPPRVIIPSFTPQQIDRSIAKALEKVENRKSLVSNLFLQRILIQTGSAAAWHQELLATNNETLEIGEDAQKTVDASIELVNDFNLSPKQGAFGLPKFSVLNTVLADTCPKKTFCKAHKYRSTDGSCNNLNNQQWGTPGVALQRVLPPKYGDGINSPRTKADNGVPLPSGRLVSSIFAEDIDVPSDNFTLLLMQWGQFVDHDLTHTPISRGQSGFGISCCRNGKLIDLPLRHPDCFAIELPTNDDVFSKFGEQCMEFVRSLPAPRPECNFGPREQMNQITGYLDGSSIYASSLDVQRRLRSFQSGKLKTQNVGNKPLLPANPSECSDNTQNFACFAAGDGRVNEQIELALMHTVWVREHNRVANALFLQHPTWSDEALFQEARRIVIAQIQHITYNEFLPIILGQRYMDTFQLTTKSTGWTKLYDSNLNAGITNVFATAAYRFGHTLIQSNIHGYGKFGNIRENLQLSKQHFAPFSLYKEDGIDDFIRGCSFQSSQAADRFFSQEITDHLFQGNLNFGLDLFALNVQRGRDHGLPPYNEWREICGSKRAQSWNDLEEIMDVESIKRLASVYNNVDEIDLFVGGIAEKALNGALLGPTFVCLIGDQFSRLRRGDRFFYEEEGQLSSFSEGQLHELRKSSLARIMCDNSNNIVVMQPLVFLKPSFLNQRVPCNSQAIPRVDLRAWINEVPAVA